MALLDHLPKPARDTIGYLKELRDTVGAVAFGLTLVVAAILISAEFFSGVALVVFLVGMVFILFGSLTYLLGWAATRRAATAPSPQQPSAQPSPWTQATGMHRNWEQNEARRAIRLVREELMDNWGVLHAAGVKDEIPFDARLRGARWAEFHDDFARFPDPRPYRQVRGAYRAMGVEQPEEVGGIRPQIGLQACFRDPLEMGIVIGVIDAAVKVLDEFE